MRQLIQMFLFDMKMSFKNFMGAYMVIVPMVILIILRLFIPTVESSTVTFAVVTEGLNAVDREMIEQLESFGEIKSYAAIEDMEQKLRGIGTVEGLYWDPESNQYVSVLERTKETNTIFSFAARYARQGYFRKTNPDAARITEFSYEVPPELTDRTKTSPVATVGGSIFIVFMIIVTAFLIGLAVVDDKDQGTILALRVSPVNKADYFIGRSIFPLIVTIFYTIVALLVLGLIHVNIVQVYIVVLVSFTVTLLFGLFIGAMGKNEVEAIGYGKILSIVLMLAILGATLLPDNWHWVVWWSPVYWVFDLLEEVFTETATWKGIIIKSAVMLAVTGAYFILLRKKIIKGLS